MKKYLRAFLVMVALFSILLIGCISKIKYPSYYTLTLPSAAGPPAKESELPSITVREFRAPGYLRQGPIVYRTSPVRSAFMSTIAGRSTPTIDNKCSHRASAGERQFRRGENL